MLYFKDLFYSSEEGLGRNVVRRALNYRSNKNLITSCDCSYNNGVDIDLEGVVVSVGYN